MQCSLCLLVVRRFGEGVMLFKNKDYYRGSWRNNQREGRGSLTDGKTGQTIEYEWANDRICGMSNATHRIKTKGGSGSS